MDYRGKPARTHGFSTDQFAVRTALVALSLFGAVRLQRLSERDDHRRSSLRRLEKAEGYVATGHSICGIHRTCGKCGRRFSEKPRLFSAGENHRLASGPKPTLILSRCPGKSCNSHH